MSFGLLSCNKILSFMTLMDEIDHSIQSGTGATGEFMIAAICISFVKAWQRICLKTGIINNDMTMLLNN